MADLQTITIADGSGNTVEEGITFLRDDLIKAANDFIDTSDPTTPPDGRSWVRSDGANNGVKYAQVNSVKTEVLYQYILNQALDCNDKELKSAHLESIDTVSIPAPSAGEESRYGWDGTQERSFESGSTQQWYRGRANMDGSSFMYIPCALNVNQPASTAATPSTATIRGGYLFDAATDSMNAVALKPIPNTFTAAHDCKLIADVMLANGESASDTIDLDGGWATLSVTDLPTKTQEAFSAASQIITTATQYARYQVELAVDHDAAGNVIAAGDEFVATLTHDIAAGVNPVAGIIIVSVCLAVPVWNPIDEE